MWPATRQDLCLNFLVHYQIMKHDNRLPKTIHWLVSGRQPSEVHPCTNDNHGGETKRHIFNSVHAIVEHKLLFFHKIIKNSSFLMLCLNFLVSIENASKWGTSSNPIGPAVFEIVSGIFNNKTSSFHWLSWYK